jgi:AraC-like DNA-binding protein
LGWSSRRLIEQFREHAGLPPKTVARLHRFGRVLKVLDGARGLNWAAIAGECGYYDQSHLVRDFVQFTGDSPRAYMRRLKPEGGVRHEAG